MDKIETANNSNDYLSSQDGRKISIEHLEDLVLAGQSWSSLRFDKLAKIIGRKFSIPECNDPRLVGSFPVLEWAEMPETSYNPSVIYCTWAAAGNEVSEDFIARQLEAFNKLQIHPDIFIIDAGWFTAAGDWFSVDSKKFPNGLQGAVEKIHSQKMEAWLWWGPLNVDQNSQFAKEHSDWLVRRTNEEDPAIFKFYQTTLAEPHFIPNLQSPEVQEQIQKVCRQIKDWGFDGVKADFLSNAFFIPGLDQLQALTYIHDILVEIKKSELGVLACGCPFTAALGVADFIRVSNDSGRTLGSDNPKINQQINRVMVKGVDRGVRQMTSPVKEFGINPDPDMFYQFDLRKKDAQKLEEAQRFSIENGGCLNFGDDFSSLSESQAKKVIELYQLFKSVNG